MKKILIFVAVATTLFLTSCVKNKEIYRGDSKQFVYTPSYASVFVVGVPINGIATLSVGGRLVSVQCLTPSQNGDAVVTDAPIIPQMWDWNQSGNEYRPSGFTFNSAAGFSNNSCKTYFVEIFADGSWRFWNGVSVPWGDAPNPASWVNSFEYPRTWVLQVNIPFRGKVSKYFSNGANYRVSL